MKTLPPAVDAQTLHVYTRNAFIAAEHLGRLDVTCDPQLLPYSEWHEELNDCLRALYTMLPPAEMRDLATQVHQHRRKHADVARTILSGEFESGAPSDEEQQAEYLEWLAERERVVS